LPLYFGEVVKMCANVSYLMMTLNRWYLLLIGKDHADQVASHTGLTKLEVKWVVGGSVVFSAACSTSATPFSTCPPTESFLLLRSAELSASECESTG
jgi:hypothetical protein